MSIKTLSSREIYRNKWMRLREDQIERDNGAQGIYAVIEKDPACIIIPMEHAPEGDFLWLVNQYRYTIGARFTEFPQGGWEMKEIVPEELARGELQEETGLLAGKMTQLGMHWIAYGAMRQEHYVYLAEDLTQGPIDSRDEEEHDLQVLRVSVEDFEAMILNGEVADNCTCAAWGLYKVWREQKQRSD